MADGKQFPQNHSNEQTEPDSDKPQKTRSQLTRRDFLIKSNAGAVAVGVMSGAGFAASLAQAPSAPARTAPAAPTTPAVKTRRVSLEIDGKKHEINVDVRESLWETMNYQLGLSNSNLGCDRAQCGACTVLVDGRAVNGCSLLTARLGRGQKILTVAGIATGPGPRGLHPVQRAFWLEGGFQCGICTRGFIMSAFSLLAATTSPTRVQIREALAGNVCRCSEYPKMYDAVETAAANMRANPLGPIQRAAPARAGGEDVDTSGNLD